MWSFSGIVLCAKLLNMERADRRVETMTKSQRASFLLGLALALPVAFAGMACAGGASLDEDEEDQSNAGVSFFGFAQVLDRGSGVADAKVRAVVRNTNASPQT